MSITYKGFKIWGKRGGKKEVGEAICHKISCLEKLQTKNSFGNNDSIHKVLLGILKITSCKRTNIILWHACQM